MLSKLIGMAHLNVSPLVNLRVQVPLLCEQCLPESRSTTGVALLIEQWHAFRFSSNPPIPGRRNASSIDAFSLSPPQNRRGLR